MGYFGPGGWRGADWVFWGQMGELIKYAFKKKKNQQTKVVGPSSKATEAMGSWKQSQRFLKYQDREE